MKLSCPEGTIGTVPASLGWSFGFIAACVSGLAVFQFVLVVSLLLLFGSVVSLCSFLCFTNYLAFVFS